jgi:beta-glucanase (GH16 family)
MVMAPGADAEAWQLVWSDEFDGPSLNTSNWSHEVNANGGGNNELQYYTARAANSFIRDGKLVIKAIKETYVGPEGTRGYTSARLRTVNKRDFTYGRMEARIKMPAGQGLWPAFWMLPTDWEYGGWPTSGEIDIMEYRGDQPNTLHGTIHYGGPYPAHTFTGTTLQTPGDLSTAFHDYAIEWEEGVIRWYFDGELYLTQNQWFSGGGIYPAPFDKRFHFLLNVAVGGNFLPNPPPDADYFPQEMEVDWVRVYQRAAPVEQTAFPGPVPTLPTRIQAENFDAGGQGVGSLDNTSANQGGAYRTDELVDIEPTSDAGGGHNIGWIIPGEYLEYTVQVATPGIYRLDARVAADDGPDSFEIRVTPSTGSPITRTTIFNATGGFQTWQTVQAGEFPLPAGSAVIRFRALTNEFNLNWIEAVFVSPDPGPGTPAFEINFDNSPTTGPTGGVIGCDWGFGNPFSSGNPITSFVPNAGGLAYNITGNFSNGGDSFSYVVFYVRTDPDVNTGRDFTDATHLQFDARVNAGNNLAWNVRLEDSDGDPALEYLVDRVALNTLNSTFQTITIPVSEFTDGNNGVPVNMEAIRAIAIFADGGPNTQTATLTPRLTIDNLRFLVPPTVIPGDADGDGVLTVADVTAIHNFLSGANPSPLPGSGDANGDGLVNIADADLIVDHLVNATPLP